MPGRRFRDTYTGDVYELPIKEGYDPSEDEIENLINRQKRIQSPKTEPKKSLWGRINQPLTDIGSRTARGLSDRITQGGLRQTNQSYFDPESTLGKVEGFGRRANNVLAGFMGGAAEGVGNLIDEQTNPVDIAANVTGLKAVRTLGKAGQAGNKLWRAGNALTGARGVMNVGESIGVGSEEGIDLTNIDYGKLSTGALETLLSKHGFDVATRNAGAPKVGPMYGPENVTYGPENVTYGPENRPYGYREQAIRDRQRQAAEAALNPQKRLGTGTAYAGMGGQVVDVRNNPLANRQLVDEASRRGILDPSMPSRGPVYSGRSSQGLNHLPDIDVRPLRSESVGTRPIEPNTPREQISSTSTYEKMDDSILKILSKNGDTNAINELGRRQGIAKPKMPKTDSIYGDEDYGHNFDEGIYSESRSENNPVVSPPQAEAVSTTPLQTKKGFFEGIKDTFNLNMINSDNSYVQKMKPAYQKWVNDRAARKGISYNVKQDFKDLESMGLEGVHAYNAGERGGRLADVQKWFDNMHEQVSKSGIKLGFKENYLPQIWDNSQDEIKKVFGNKRLTLKPGFAFKSIIESYQEGMAKGLTPKYKSIPDLMGYYTEVANKSMADRQFFQSLRDQKLITTRASRKAKGWKALDQDIFPTVKTKEGNVLEWHAPPEVHAILDNYLSDRGDTSKSILRGVQLTKDVAMASGLPGTAFNAHGFNMLRRSATVDGLKGFTRALGYMANPGASEGKGLGATISKGIEDIVPWKSAAKTIEENRQMIPEIMKHGGRLGVEGHDFDTKLSDSVLGKWGSKGANKLTEWHKDMFETHLFDKMIPALKIDYYKSSVADLVKSGLNPTEARKQAARAMNLAFAGVNYDELATNKGLLDISRAFFLAPDWYASNIGVAKNTVQSFMDSNHPGAKLYRDVGKGLIGAYALANVANLVTTGMSDDDGPKFMVQNESGRALDIDTGTYTMNEKGEKKKVYISPFGTAFDAFKIPIGILSEVFKDISAGEGSPVSAALRPLKNRLSLPAHAGLNLLSNTDDFGRRVYGRDVYGRDIPPMTELGNLSREALSPVTPAYVKGIAGKVTGQMGDLEAISQSIEAPLSFTRQKKSTKGKRKATRKSR